MAKSRRRITLIAVLVVLFIFPLITLYYLDSGISFRKNLGGELTPKDTFPNLRILSLPDSTSEDSDPSVKGKYVLVLKGNTESRTTIEENSPIYLALEQFRNRDELLILIYGPSFTTHSRNLLVALVDEENMTLATTDDDEVLLLWPDSLKKKFSLALVDSNAQVRNYYNLESDENINTFIEHLSITLPEEYLFDRRHKSGKR